MELSLVRRSLWLFVSPPLTDCFPTLPRSLAAISWFHFVCLSSAPLHFFPSIPSEGASCDSSSRCCKVFPCPAAGLTISPVVFACPHSNHCSLFDLTSFWRVASMFDTTCSISPLGLHGSSFLCALHWLILFRLPPSEPKQFPSLSFIFSFSFFLRALSKFLPVT